MVHDTDNDTAITELTEDGGARPSLNQDRRPVLVSLRGELLAKPIPLERDIVVLGRALEADIRLNDSKVSRLHARIHAEVDEETGRTSYRIKDLGSTNGTMLNGQVVNEAVLTNGDKIVVGDHLFRFDLLDEIDREFQQQIQRLLAHDELTGLLTSKSFFSELRREAARAEEESRPFCVLMLDIDHFKDVNDTYGHMAGSRALQEMGSLIITALRSGDVAARIGGEEFATFLLDADYAQALVAAERVRQAVEQHQFFANRRGEAGAEESFRMTISIGVAAYPDDAKDPIQLVELADSALYRAKRSGRNIICAYRPSLAATEKPLPPRRS
ncbi:MAG TPA: GGDEF domain-containing protein [Pyrinomonadaceae bacterium]|nr:GGDEF domain-containing protein [Pyrinomonadaceae bacterium]